MHFVFDILFGQVVFSARFFTLGFNIGQIGGASLRAAADAPPISHVLLVPHDFATRRHLG
jgi:hypothetical protein